MLAFRAHRRVPHLRRASAVNENGVALKDALTRRPQKV